MMILTWVVFVTALFFTFDLTGRLVHVIGSAIAGIDWTINYVQYLVPALFWGLFGYLLMS